MVSLLLITWHPGAPVGCGALMREVRAFRHTQSAAADPAMAPCRCPASGSANTHLFQYSARKKGTLPLTLPLRSPVCLESLSPEGVMNDDNCSAQNAMQQQE